jgi:hypothetical protein
MNRYDEVWMASVCLLGMAGIYIIAIIVAFGGM